MTVFSPKIVAAWDAEVDLTLVEAELDTEILRQAPLGDVRLAMILTREVRAASSVRRVCLVRNPRHEPARRLSRVEVMSELPAMVHQTYMNDRKTGPPSANSFSSKTSTWGGALHRPHQLTSRKGPISETCACHALAAVRGRSPGGSQPGAATGSLEVRQNPTSSSAKTFVAPPGERQLVA